MKKQKKKPVVESYVFSDGTWIVHKVDDRYFIFHNCRQEHEWKIVLIEDDGSILCRSCKTPLRDDLIHYYLHYYKGLHEE